MQVARASVVSGALVVGSVIAVDPAGLAPFGPAKWLVVSTCGALAGGLALWTGRRPLHRRSVLAWATLLAFLALGALFGGDLPTSLLGQPDRHLGLITWLLFLLLFCAGQQFDVPDRGTLARAAVVATLALGAWSVWELIAGAPIGTGTNTDRLTGPFGSAAYLGAATCLLTPICAGVALDRTVPRWWRALAITAAALATLALVGSGARAAWTAAVVITAIVVVMVGPTRRVVVSGGLIAIVAIAFSAPHLGDVVERSSGAGSRLDEWSVASRVIADHPVVGVGPEGYRIAVSEGVDAHYERTYGRDRVLPDRAHSAPLDVALNGGVPAALIWCALVGFVCWRALGLLRGTDATIAGIAVGVVGYATQQLLLFPLAEIDPVWWLFAGVVVSARPAPVDRTTDARVHRWPAVVAFAVAPVALVAGVLDVAADRLAHRALNHSDATQALADAERAVQLRPDNTRYRLALAEVLTRTGTLADNEAAVHQMNRALAWSADDPIAGDGRASLLLDRAGATRTAPDIDAALRAWQALVDHDPVRARWQLQLGRAAVLAGDVDLARAAWTAAAGLSHDDDTAAQLLAALDRP